MGSFSDDLSGIVRDMNINHRETRKRITSSGYHCLGINAENSDIESFVIDV